MLLLSAPSVFGNPPPEGGHSEINATDASCGCLYSIIWGWWGTELEEIEDPDTPIVVEIGNLGPPGRFPAPSGMAVDWATGTAYTIDATTGELVTLDPTTGTATVVATGVGPQDALAINRVEVPGPDGTTIPAGTLFGATDNLVTIDVNTGEVTVIGPIGRRISGLAFFSSRSVPIETLYGAESGADGKLVTISTETGLGTVIGPIGRDIGALVYTFIGGGRSGASFLWGSDVGTGSIVELDPTTGAVTRDVVAVPDGYLPQGLGHFTRAVMPVRPASWGSIKNAYR
jgi:hypothetical protein